MHSTATIQLKKWLKKPYKCSPLFSKIINLETFSFEFTMYIINYLQNML